MIRNRRGDEIVEAAMVLPILILIILSMILLIVYFFSALCSQTDLHRQILTETAENDAAYAQIKKESETSSELKGAVNLHIGRKISAKGYVLHPADLLRAGEMIGISEEE